MTNEEKELLLKDLCARLPYTVKCCVYDDVNDLFELSGFKYNDTPYFESLDRKGNDGLVELQFVKPYLRPMSSMTATESIEYQKRVKVIQDVERTLHWCDTPESIDWLDEHHFDYRGLIGKGLALEAPDGMYNNQ